jgi:hypothetical protein
MLKRSDMTRVEVVDKYQELHELYSKTDKSAVLVRIEECIFNNDIEGAEELIKQLPDKSMLQEQLYEYLKGKSVYFTLKKLVNGKCDNLYEGLKGLFSLGTHLCVELEKGNMEYRSLLDDTLAGIHKHLQ